MTQQQRHRYLAVHGYHGHEQQYQWYDGEQKGVAPRGEYVAHGCNHGAAGNESESRYGKCVYGPSLHSSTSISAGWNTTDSSQTGAARKYPRQKPPENMAGPLLSLPNATR